MNKVLWLNIIVPLLLSGCSTHTASLSADDMSLYVYEGDNQITINNTKEGETFTYEFEGENIRIEDDKVIALKGNTETTVTALSSDGRSCEFKVTVNNREYTSTHEDAEESEGWFNSVDIDSISDMNSNFANGIDISSCKQLYDNGQKFYNSDGVEQSLFYILKDAGVNWIRLRLWNKPFDEYEEDGITKIYQYGGGNCDINNVSWMAHEAKAAGLKILLDFHYSDFWADPNDQVVPKDWVDIDSVSDMADAISEFTTESLQTLKDNDAVPDMVTIGNETYAGMLLHNPGGVTTTGRNNLAPKYSYDHTSRTNGTEAKYDFTGSKSSNTTIRTYIKAGVDAVKSFDSTIITSIHFVKGFSDPNTSIKFFQTFDDLDIDVFGLSGYSYWHYSNMSTLRSGLTTIANAFPTKSIAILETSYGFTYETDNWASNTFSASSSTCKPVSGYECSIQGQAEMLRDTTEAAASISSCFGVFYWEGAWTPTKKSGWADYTSKASWANQGFFSYNGKALGSLEVYNKMKG